MYESDLFVSKLLMFLTVAKENVNHHVMHLRCLEEFNLREGTSYILTDLLLTFLVLEEPVPRTLVISENVTSQYLKAAKDHLHTCSGWNYYLKIGLQREEFHWYDI